MDKALELANELDNMLKAIGLTDNRVPTMLRQQQEKLTKYELRHVAQRDRIAILEMQHKQQQVEIEALKAKTLTDEEILKIWKEFDDKDADNWFIAIARAILRKAQEK